MAKCISKRVREEAAICCQLAASNTWDMSQCQEQFTWSDRASELADAACVAVIDADWLFFLVNPNAAWAEAESLLRCGWSPGEGGMFGDNEESAPWVGGTRRIDRRDRRERRKRSVAKRATEVVAKVEGSR